MCGLMVQYRAMATESQSPLVAIPIDEITRLRAELEQWQREAKVLRVERDLLKERINAFERKLFAAKSYEGARGALMTDGYAPYGSVARAYALVHLGCLAHARRGFIEAEAAIPKAVRPADHL